jgi:hypothetical protein
MNLTNWRQLCKGGNLVSWKFLRIFIVIEY